MRGASRARGPTQLQVGGGLHASPSLDQAHSPSPLSFSGSAQVSQLLPKKDHQEGRGPRWALCAQKAPSADKEAQGRIPFSLGSCRGTSPPQPGCPRPVALRSPLMLRCNCGCLGTRQGAWLTALREVHRSPQLITDLSAPSFLLQRGGQGPQFSCLLLEPRGTSQVTLSLWAPQQNSAGPVS